VEEKYLGTCSDSRRRNWGGGGGGVGGGGGGGFFCGVEVRVMVWLWRGGVVLGVGGNFCAFLIGGAGGWGSWVCGFVWFGECGGGVGERGVCFSSQSKTTQLPPFHLGRGASFVAGHALPSWE